MLRRLFPFIRWFPLSLENLRADFVAGLTVSLVLIPQSMAYAELAGLPPWIGLYASFLPVIFAALWGSSNHLQTGPVAIGSLLTASALMPLAQPGSGHYVLLASQLVFVIGSIRLLIALLRLTFIVNFLSRPVVEGFIHAGVLIIASSQVFKIFGLKLKHGEHYLLDLWSVAQQLGDTNWASFALGVGSLIVLFLIKRSYPRTPAALIVVVLSTSIVYLLGLADPANLVRPVSIVGKIPAGIPKPVQPVPDWSTFLKLLPGAAAIVFVGFMEMCSVAKAVATQSKQKLDMDQEILGQGMASLSGAFSGAYPVSGSFSRTALNYAAGAKTGLSAVFTGFFVMICLLFFTEFLFYLPTATLAAIIIFAVINLTHCSKFVYYFRVSKADGIAGISTFIATLLFAPHLDRGILFGALLSIVMYLYRTMKPNVAVLGLHPDGTMRDAAKHGLPVEQKMPTIRFDGLLYFANVSYFEETLLTVRERYPEAKYIAVSCSGINAIDASGEEMLREVTNQLRASGAQLVLVGIKEPVLDVMKRTGLDLVVGKENMFRTMRRAREELLGET